MTIDKGDQLDARLALLTLDSKQYNSEYSTTNDGTGEPHVMHERTLKTRLLSSQEQDILVLKDFLSMRIKEGGGETLFELGIEDDGTPMKLTKNDYDRCLQTILRVANELGVDCACINKTSRSDTYSGHLMFRIIPTSVEDMLEIRVAVMGNVDAGKSTTIGVLTQDVLDDGRGKARMGLFRHLHERESGRTSSVGGEIIGFDSKSCMVPHPGNSGRKGWDEICSKASKIISFVDLAGHEKYLKTTVFGITGNSPDFVLLLIGGNAGVIGMAKEHLGLALSLGIPLFIVITKIDRTPPNVLADTIKNLRTILKSKACQKLPLLVKTTDDVVNSVVSNVTGEGLPLLRTYLNALPSVNKYNTNGAFHFEINDIFSVPFVGTVVSGCLKMGTIHVGDKVLYGPDYFGQFTTTTIKSIQRKRISVPTARAGQSVTFALKNVRRKMVRKGMVLVACDKDVPPPKVSRRFEAEIRILYHSTTIKKKYQAMVHCGSVRQTAQITHFEQKVLRTGDRATVQFEFIKHPEYLPEGAKLIR
ncbi:hypothetical protein [Absidia glauca]|uniref:Tr-type G domain-containing protein n=1 Tax=Absidia glauca TaxID=4829 RepID=A0A163K795_ABSGL|nr:hypothetical protein [Absidia glauca]